MGAYKTKKWESALRDQLRNWIRKVNHLDILVGIPCYNNEDTIGYVVSTVGKGLAKYFPELKSGILISDGGSLDDTREKSYEAEIPEGIERRVSIYRGVPGKGTSFRAVFETAKLIKAEVCVVVDADLRSITSEWVKQLAEPILENKVDFIAPYYIRDKYDGTITNNIVYPLTRALYGIKIRQPIGGDFGFSSKLTKFYATQDVWETDVARFGIDIWMTTIALNEGFRVGQSYLGIKVHDSKDPATDLSSMFQHIISTLFYLMGIYEDKWKKTSHSQDPPNFYFSKEKVEPPAISVNLKKLHEEFLDGFKHFEPMYREILDWENFRCLRKIVREWKNGNKINFSSSLWAKILYDFAFIYQTWSRNRRRLVDIITPLYFGRVASYCQEVKEADYEKTEEIVENQAKVFEELRPYLIKKFELWEEE
ncbi:MAG: glycosyltransferase [Candidatus Aminicenantia bacterium]